MDWSAELERALAGESIDKLVAEILAREQAQNKQAIVSDIESLPSQSVFTWKDGRRYILDSAGPAPGGVTPMSRDDFLALIAGIGE